MQRPVMDPMFLRETPDSRRNRRLAAAFSMSVRGLRWAGRKLLSRPFRRARHAAAEAGERGLYSGILYRLLFLPIFLSGLSAAAVFFATHPPVPLAAADPSSQGVYFDPVQFQSDDGTPLAAWLIPAVDARRVVLQKDRVLRAKHPAVVLVHDFGRSPEQMLPLLAPLHEDGVVVAVVGLRGVGAGRPRGQTFGVNEAADVAAAVRHLRRRAFVDPERVAVFGIGTGATAALLAAERDVKIAAVVLADIVPSPDRAIARYLGPDYAGLRWMQAVNQWAFQVGYHVDLEEMNPARMEGTLATRPVLRLTGYVDADGRPLPKCVQQTRDFLREQLKEKPGPRPAVASVPGL